jgi:hypothetical protein
MKSFEVRDVLELLRREIDRVGGQSEWARQTGIDRSLINRVLNARRLPTSQLCRALGLEWVVVRHAVRGDDEPESSIVSKRDVLRILSEQIKNAGSIAAWCKLVGEERTYVSSVLHNRKSPSKKILAGLNLSEQLLCAQEPRAKTRNRVGQKGSPSKRPPHARW